MNQLYEMVVGLEVHAELSTETKIYCSCKNEFGREVNTNCCPICMGFPGTLPTLNEKVVDAAIIMGHALHCRINRICKQDRKNYFYPDLPKAYQISQHDVPLCENGYLDVLLEDGDKKRIGITRIHIEEDAGKLLHDDSFDGTLVDFNRSGVPLIEIVSEPDLRTSQEAKAYLETIRSYLLYLGISDAKMQEGSIRCDVNVSVRTRGSDKLGKRCEMKNVNSFSGAVKAITYEYQRQISQLEQGREIPQETRRWDEAKGKTISMRSKEDARDYRYFPDPDLKTIVVDQGHVDALKKRIPEMPNDKVARYIQSYGLGFIEASAIVENMAFSKLFEETVEIQGVPPKMLSNWILGDIAKHSNEDAQFLENERLNATRLAQLLLQIDQGKISNAAAKKVFAKMLEMDEPVKEIIAGLGLSQVSDTTQLENVVATVLTENAQSVKDYQSGKTNAFGYLMGQCMKATQGKGNPKILKETLLQKLEG